MATGKILNTSRTPKIPLGVKAERHHCIITHNPSSANPKETLYVRIPRLQENTFFVPSTFCLTADVIISGDPKNYVVNNLGRNLISKLLVKWGATTILDINNYDLYSTFKELWLSPEERNDKIFEGIQSETMRKLRSGVTVADANNNQKQLKETFGKKYMIPLDFELMSNHAPFYKFPIQEDIIFEITLAPKEDVIVADNVANMNYKLENICMEYETVTHSSLASQLSANYNAGFSIFYDWVDHFKTVSVEANDTLINENMNYPRRSIKGIMLLFVSKYADGKRDSEKFENPGIKNVKVTIEGQANKLFVEGMRPQDQWKEAKRFFMSEHIKTTHDSNMTMEKFYCENKFCLFLDLRTTHDNDLHGSGKALTNTKDGIQLAITKKSGTGPYQMHVFVICDAQTNVQNCQIMNVTN